jgi:hypothetical protein
MLMLQRNMLSPSLGSLNYILVDSEDLYNRKCWDYTGDTGYGLVQHIPSSPLPVVLTDRTAYNPPT